MPSDIAQTEQIATEVTTDVCLESRPEILSTI